MDKLRLFVSIGICGVLFGGCGFFTEWGEDVKDIWTEEPKAVKTKSKAKDCAPKDFRERVAKYKEQYKNDDDMYPKVVDMGNTSMFQKQKTHGTYSWQCSKYMAQAYSEIIKENGAPKSYNEEVKFLDKVKKRFTRLFALENPNGIYECALGECEK